MPSANALSGLRYSYFIAVCNLIVSHEFKVTRVKSGIVVAVSCQLNLFISHALEFLIERAFAGVDSTDVLIDFSQHAGDRVVSCHRS